MLSRHDAKYGTRFHFGAIDLGQRAREESAEFRMRRLFAEPNRRALRRGERGYFGKTGSCPSRPRIAMPATGISLPPRGLG